MQKTLNFMLDKKHSKPVFKIMREGLPIICMLDTGADIPVWCSGLEYFKILFPDSKKADGLFLLGGFGKGAVEVEVYVIPRIEFLGMIFTNLYVVISDKRRFSYDMILSNTMFSKIDYSILNRNKDIPELQLVYDKDEYCTGIKWYDDKYIQKIYSFTQDKE